MSDRSYRQLIKWIASGEPRIVNETPTHTITEAGPVIIRENKQTGAVTVFPRKLL